jgi:hypothetical protein
MAVKISPAGECACRLDISRPDWMDRVCHSGTESLTRPIPPSMAVENELMTFTVGFSHLVRLLWLLRDWPIPGICCRSMMKISPGE